MYISREGILSLDLALFTEVILSTLLLPIKSPVALVFFVRLF